MRTNEINRGRPNIHKHITVFYENPEYRTHLDLLRDKHLQVSCEHCHFPFVSEQKKNRHKADNPECKQTGIVYPPKKTQKIQIQVPPNSVVTLGRYCAVQDQKILQNNVYAFLHLFKSQTAYQPSPLNAFLKVTTIAAPKKFQQKEDDVARRARAQRRISAMTSLHGAGKAYHTAEDYKNNIAFKPWTEEELLQLFKEKHPEP